MTDGYDGKSMAQVKCFKISQVTYTITDDIHITSSSSSSAVEVKNRTGGGDRVQLKGRNAKVKMTGQDGNTKANRYREKIMADMSMSV